MNAPMGTMCGSGECCTNHDEKGRKHKRRFASDTVAYEANQDLPDDFP